jgi:hypothetical protein
MTEKRGGADESLRSSSPSGTGDQATNSERAFDLEQVLHKLDGKIADTKQRLNQLQLMHQRKLFDSTRG